MIKKNLAALVLAAQLMSASQTPQQIKNTPEPKQKPQPKNLKLFNIDGVEVWALNKKNAIRKAGNHKPIK